LSDFFVKLHSRVEAGDGNLGKRWKIYRFNIGHLSNFFSPESTSLIKSFSIFAGSGR